jgi:hypothetical protein
MKGLFALVAVSVLFSLIACAGLPAPEGTEDSLVVGWFVVDFPDGYFNLPSRTISSNVKLHFENTTTGQSFSVSTWHGYFHFLSNGKDGYHLERFEYSGAETGGGSFFFGNLLDIEFTAKPGKILHLGAIKFNYRHPKRMTRVSAGRNVDYYDFEESLDRTWDEEEAKEYLRSQDPESPWLSYEVVLLRAD